MKKTLLTLLLGLMAVTAAHAQQTVVIERPGILTDLATYKAKHYYLVILSFVLGAVTGAFAFRDVSPYAVFIIPAVFCVVLWIISVEKKLKRT